MIQKLILFIQITFTSVYCYPCDGMYAWKCPNDTMCISKINELCAPPPFEIQRCSNGGDVGKWVCSAQFCEENGLHKCPFDPFCVERGLNSGVLTACYQCPHGTTNEGDCTYYSTVSGIEKCGSKRYQKYYNKALKACNNVIDCPEDGRDEQHCNSDEECQKETHGVRPIKCPFDNVCVESEERKCTCPSGCNQIISNLDCQKIQLTQLDSFGEIGEYGPEMRFVKCHGSNKCILKSKMCDGVQDCPNNEDELNCTQGWCKANNKWMCPSEKRCIEKKFLADGDPRTIYYDTDYSKMQRNKCMKNQDEDNIFYVDLCHQKNNYVCPKKNEPLHGIKDHCTSVDQSCIPKKGINVTKYIENVAGLHNTYLWQCSLSSDEYIPMVSVCNNVFNCFKSGFNDESEQVCERFSLLRAAAWSMGIVLGILLIRFKVNRNETYKLAISCDDCLSTNAFNLNDKEWEKKHRLLLLLFNIDTINAVEFLPKATPWPCYLREDLEKAYKDVHNIRKKDRMKDLIQFVSKRIEAKFNKKSKRVFNAFGEEFQMNSYDNLLWVLNFGWYGDSPMDEMRWRHEFMYKRIFDMEMKLHKGNKIKVLKCLKCNLGTSKAAFDVIDCNDKPTKLTQIAVIASVILKSFQIHKAITPVIKLLAFTIDFTKDLGLLAYMIGAIFGPQADTAVSHNDYKLLAFYIFSLILAQVLISLYALINRKRAFALCSHSSTPKTEALFYGVIVVFFPLTGAIMATEKYYTEQIVDNEFDDLENNNEEGNRMTKLQYEQLITKLRFVEHQNGIGGFEAVKMMENSLESFLQTSIVFIMLAQLPFEGILTTQYFGPLYSSRGEMNNTLIILVGSTAAGFFFLGSGMASYVVKLQKEALGIKEKIFLIFIYLIQIGISLMTFTALFLMQSSIHLHMGSILWGTIGVLKLSILLVFSLKTKRQTETWTEMMIFITCNLNLPAHLEQFEESHYNSKVEAKLNKRFTFPWAINMVENVVRGTLIWLMGSSESFDQMLPSITTLRLLAIVILSETLVLLLWYIYFKKLYVWKDILNEKKKENVTLSFQDKLESAFTKPLKVKSILKGMVSVLFLMFSLLLLISLSNTLNEDTIYKDCYEVNIVNDKPNGLYYIQSNTFPKILTNCTNGMALVQKTDPDVGNPKHYFDRPFKYFKDGFGYPYKEFWLGLENIFQLNQMQNHSVLRLEFTEQVDGESFWVEYDDFQMSNVEFDNITYNPSDIFPKRHQYEAYPITKLGKMTSSLEYGSFIFMLPLFNEESLLFKFLKDRTALKLYHHTLYLGFTALDNATNSECSREYSSGWWYPYALHFDYGNQSVKEFCTHHPFNGTNLNGVCDVLHPNQTTRTIAFCQMNDVNDCVTPKYKRVEGNHKAYTLVDGWSYNNVTTYKLKNTKMWLGRKM